MYFEIIMLQVLQDYASSTVLEEMKDITSTSRGEWDLVGQHSRST
jgi:hypothetical protein